MEGKTWDEAGLQLDTASVEEEKAVSVSWWALMDLKPPRPTRGRHPDATFLSLFGWALGLTDSQGNWDENPSGGKWSAVASTQEAR